MAARSSDLPGVITAQMMEQLMAGYEHAFDSEELDKDLIVIPAAVKMIMRKAGRRTWNSLAKERISDTAPRIP